MILPFLLFTSSQGSVTFSCTEPASVAVTFSGPHSFLRLPVGAPASTGVSVGLQFRTWNEAGLLLTFKLPQQAGAVWLFLSRARLFLQVHMSGRTPQELSTGQPADHNPPSQTLALEQHLLGRLHTSITVEMETE